MNLQSNSSVWQYLIVCVHCIPLVRKLAFTVMFILDSSLSKFRLAFMAIYALQEALAYVSSCVYVTECLLLVANPHQVYYVHP